MPTITPRQSILLETSAARDQAEVLLKGLLAAKSHSERRLTELRQSDPMKSVTGRSSIDNAISSTRRMIEALDRSLLHLRQELSEEDLTLLEESERSVEPTILG